MDSQCYCSSCVSGIMWRVTGESIRVAVFFWLAINHVVVINGQHDCPQLNVCDSQCGNRGRWLSDLSKLSPQILVEFLKTINQSKSFLLYPQVFFPLETTFRKHKKWLSPVQEARCVGSLLQCRMHRHHVHWAHSVLKPGHSSAGPHTSLRQTPKKPWSPLALVGAWASCITLTLSS